MKENAKFKGEYLEGSDKGKEFIGWNSRSMAVTAIVCCQENDDLLFLVEKRGPGCPDNIGKYVFPCGYINWGESLREAAARELYEETGLGLEPKNFVFAGINDDPTENRQNITARFVQFCPELKNLYKEFVNTDTKSRGGEDNECEEIILMSGKQILKNPEKFAFNHSHLAKIVLGNLTKIKKGEYYWDSLTDKIKAKSCL